MQTPYDGALAIFAMPMRPLSEDCLYLNVYTAATPHEKWPVMMWMHGGGLLRGGSSETPIFDGSALARKGVVVVTINYRLNVFGYLAHPELTAESPHHSSGNYGTLDQIEALKWIHKNITAFGGDPGRVTIFGESAGSWSVNTLVASPLTKGLITGAIGESGGRFGPGTYLGEDRNGMSAEKRGLAFAKNAGAGSIKALRAVPAEKLLTINAGGTNENVDGWVLPDEIRTIYAQRKQNHIPILIGENANEMTAVTSRASIPKTMEEYRKRIFQQYGDMAKDFDRAYPVMSEADIARAVLDNNRDTTFSVHIRRWARAHAVSGDPTFLYLFSHVPPHPDSSYLGAFHMSEIPYVFNNLNRIGVTYEGPVRLP
jgi:para-nitrobenzyl esterase